MATEWKKVRLDEMGTISRGRSKHRPRNDPSLFDGKYPFIQTADVKNSNLYISEYSQTYNEKGLSQSKLWQPGTLCITIAANIADTGILSIPACFPDSVMGFIPFNEVSDVRFVKYCFDILQRECKAISVGAAQDNLSWDKLSRIKFPCPPLETQQKIAGILSAYDDLIENNRKQIKLLEEAAQKFYKEWFVKLNFPGHENVKIVDDIPEGWKKEKLINLVDVQYGYAFDGSKFNSDCKGKPIIRIRNIPQGTTDDFTTEQATDDYIVHNGDIVVGMDGEFHINTWNQGDAYLVQRACSFRPHNENMKGYILQAIYAPIKFFENTVVGATVAHLGKKHIDTIEIWTCNEELYIPFQNMFRKRQTLLNQIQLLQSARDKLLPRLMNREYL